MTQKLTFVNGAKAACGCRHEFSSGGGEYSDVASVHLCAMHAGAPVLDDRWKARMLDGRAPERDEMGLGDHPELPMLDEGMMPRSFFAALGLELAHTSAEDQLDWDVLGAMSEAVNWTDWQPNPPHGDGWKLVSIFDTEDGPVAWWLRELPEAEDGTTTIRILQAEVEKLKARIARAGAAPAAVAGPAWDKTRDSLATLLLGLARRPFLDFDVACIALDAATEPGMPLAYMRSAPAAPALEAPQGEYPHEQMDAMALARYKVAPSHASMLWSHAVVAGDGAQQLYVGREVECQNMARKFAGAFLDGAFAFHSMAAAPTTQAAPALEAPAAPTKHSPGAVYIAVSALEQERARGYRQGLAAATRTAPLAAAPQAPNCTRCSGSGEDPEGYLTHGRGPDDHTVDGPCRECDGTGAAPQAPAAPSEIDAREQVARALGLGADGLTPFAWSYLIGQIEQLVECEAELCALKAAPAAPGIDQLLDALSQHDDPCDDIADALDRVRALRAEADRLTRDENARADAEADRLTRAENARAVQGGAA